MVKGRPARRMRRASIWLLSAVVAMVVVFTVQQAASVQEAATREDRRRTTQELTNLVALWEGLVTDRIRSWTDDLVDSREKADREVQLRSTVAWFDAFYVWSLSPSDQEVWPVPSPKENVSVLLEEPCLLEANRHRATGHPREAAEALVNCVPPTPAHGLLASFLAARVLLSENNPEGALRVLENATPPLRMPLTRAAERNIDVGRLILRREQALTALELLGQHDQKTTLAVDTIGAIADLSGADLPGNIEVGVRLWTTLPDTDERKASLKARLERADRRLVAYREINERLQNDDPTATIGELHFVQDLYSQPGFLLVWMPIDQNRRAAIQVDALPLLQALMETLPASTDLQVVDPRGHLLGFDGRVLTDKDPVDISLSLPLGRLFPQYRLAAPTHVPGQDAIPVHLLTPLAPLGVSIILGMLAVMAQVTAERREQELHRRQQEFITRVTHELKTPLAGIRLMAETLQLGAADSPETRDTFLERILTESNNLSERIDNVLAAARRPEVKALTKLGAHAVVESVVEQWRPRFKQRGATLETRLDPTPEISVDLELLHDAVGNLLDNALKYGKTGIRGIVRVRTGVQGRWVVIEVCDNGIGVPPDKRKTIFERFTRVEGPGRGKSGGHGLGLAFVAETADAHGGLVECVDGLDGGSCFRIKLPRR